MLSRSSSVGMTTSVRGSCAHGARRPRPRSGSGLDGGRVLADEQHQDREHRERAAVLGEPHEGLADPAGERVTDDFVHRDEQHGLGGRERATRPSWSSAAVGSAHPA